MAIKKISYEFNPFKEFGIKVDKKNKAAAQKDIADFVKEQVLSYVGDAKSPVKGESWKSTLSPAYAKIKSKQSKARTANMELKGDMLDAIEVVPVNSETLSLQIEGSQAPKADGHNKLIEGNPGLPKRRFIPDKDQEFKADINQGIKKILNRYSK